MVRSELHSFPLFVCNFLYFQSFSVQCLAFPGYFSYIGRGIEGCMRFSNRFVWVLVYVVQRRGLLEEIIIIDDGLILCMLKILK